MNFSINDLRSRGPRVFYVNPEDQTEIEVKLPIFQGFLNKLIVSFGGDFFKQKFQSEEIGAGNFAQGVQSILNARARAVSGAAVTANELNRLLKEFGSGKFTQASQIISKLQQMFKQNKESLTTSQNSLIRVYGDHARTHFNDPSSMSIKRFTGRYSPETDKDFYGNIGRIMDKRDHLHYRNKKGKSFSPSHIMKKVREGNLKGNKVKRLLREIYKVK